MMFAGVVADDYDYDDDDLNDDSSGSCEMTVMKIMMWLLCCGLSEF